MPMLTTREVATRLHLHQLTVVRYIQRGKIKAVRIGGRYRVDEKDVQAFLDEKQAQQVKTA